MTRARWRALLMAAAALVAAAAFALAQGRGRERLGPRPASRRPVLLLLTGLPLVFGEDFSVKGSGSEAYTKLQERYRVMPISVTDGAELAKGGLLLMAQPQAQTAENLVQLDQWVRRGGHVMIFADPMLEWPSKGPFGDVLRPTPMFADTGLLLHWGLRLDAPEERGLTERRLGGRGVVTASPGTLHGQCAITSDALVAHCRVGKGEATVVADADLLDGGDRNLDGMLEELARLESK